MQQVYCPNCGTKTNAENINVQEMVAVCGNCDTVFSFDNPAQKIKRRKVKKPYYMDVADTPHAIEMAFRTNFRLDRDSNFINTASIAGILTFLTSTFLLTSDAADFPLLLPFVTALLGIGAYYRLGLLLYNKTHITMTDHEIQVTRQPLPSLIDRTERISLSGVESFHCEETKASIEHEYDTPRYRVYAKMVDSTENLIITDLVDDYGFFVAQQLQHRLMMGQDSVDISRLADISTGDFDTVEVVNYQEKMNAKK